MRKGCLGYTGVIVPLLDYEKHQWLYLDGICVVFPKATLAMMSEYEYRIQCAIVLDVTIVFAVFKHQLQCSLVPPTKKARSGTWVSEESLERPCLTLIFV